MGSGSFEKDSPVEIVVMEKEQKTCLVHDHRFGKRERHANKANQALTERVIPALDMGGFSRLFLPTAVCCSEGDHRPVCRPEVGETMSLAVG